MKMTTRRNFISALGLAPLAALASKAAEVVPEPGPRCWACEAEMPMVGYGYHSWHEYGPAQPCLSVEGVQPPISIPFDMSGQCNCAKIIEKYLRRGVKPPLQCPIHKDRQMWNDPEWHREQDKK